MMPSYLSLLLDVFVAGLLLAVIIYCGKLNRSIRTLQNSKSEMAKLFSEFDGSVDAAERTVRELKDATHKAEDILREKMDTANSLADDLAFMIERGNKTADQIETGLKGGRGAAGKDAATGEKPSATEPRKPASAMSAPFGGRSKDSGSNTGGNTSGNAARTASIESVLEQMANRNNPGTKSDGRPHSRIRSKAEQELFDSLKSSR